MTRTEIILVIMKVVAWLAFIGLSIEAGAILTSFTVSIVSPDFSGKLYKELYLENLQAYSFLHYIYYCVTLAGLAVLKAHIAYLVIKAMDKINLKNPFTLNFVTKLERISYLIFVTWLIVIMNNAYSEWLQKRIADLELSITSGEFILVAGILYIFSQIFRRGVELQQENELTI